ncbi:hypothetical protein [Azospira restricta]|uniref:Uncharacterized protein n=1 Tax=Azospira restricta TaxID=404405 RepID=A0A974SP70_9RHOO|nr:hypothetical protein [Azospira restricta]QRJ63880.1 hypothetical protein IWH25_00525 [Azospira restricta]
MTLSLIRIALGCCAVVFASLAFSGEPGASKARALDRPVLEFHQGQYFRWSAPRGWGMNETTNGVDLFAPGRATFVSSALLAGGFGDMSPPQFLAMTLRQVNPSARVTQARRLRDQPGILAPWRVEEYEIAATYQGIPVRMNATVGVSSAYGRYYATMTLYQSPASTWEQVRTWLPAVAHSIVVTNPRQVAGADRVMLPRNNPLDNSGLIESWRQKGLSEDRISQARQEATMGYERMHDSQTGRNYNMPYEAYDAAAGGYRNPMRPNELLRKAGPGE